LELLRQGRFRSRDFFFGGRFSFAELFFHVLLRFAQPFFDRVGFPRLSFRGRFVICLFQLPGGAFCAARSMGGAWTGAFLMTVCRSFGCAAFGLASA
jgi:hypothetical protein